MKGGAHPSPFAALAFPNSKKVPFTAGLTERVFQSSHSEAQPRTHDLTATFCTVIALTTIPFFTFALAGCLQSFHPTHAQLSNRNGKFVFSGTFHIMWVEVGQDILLNRSIFLNKSDQLCINIT